MFAIKHDVTIEGVMPGTIEYFVEDFLECGTCYKRMQTMIMKRDYKLMFEGFMFKVSGVFTVALQRKYIKFVFFNSKNCISHYLVTFLYTYVHILGFMQCY